MPRDFTPLHRGQGNDGFRTSDPRSAAKRGQTIPYDVNGAPTGGEVAPGDKGDITIAGGVWTLDAGAAVANIGYTPASLGANTFTGEQAAPSLVVGTGLVKVHGGGTTTGTAVGAETLLTTTGGTNTAFGYRAGRNVTTALFNTFVGGDAGRGDVAGATGGFNTGLGYGSCGGAATLTTGNYNVAVGHQALNKITTAVNNMAVGGRAGRDLTTGGGNVLIGYQAGMSVTTGSNNVIIGSALGSAALANTLIIGANSRSDITHDGTTMTVAGALTTTGEIRANGGSRSAAYAPNGSTRIYMSAADASTNIVSWNGSTYHPMDVDAASVTLRASGTAIGTITSTGLAVTGAVSATGAITGPTVTTTGLADLKSLKSGGAGTVFDTVVNAPYNQSNLTSWTGNATYSYEGLAVDVGGYGPRQFGTKGTPTALNGSINIPATSTIANHASGISGYAKGASLTTGAVGIYGEANRLAPNALVWGLNTRSQDGGHGGLNVWGYELDMNIDNVTTTALGLDIVGGSTVEPNLSVAVNIQAIGVFTTPKKRWSYGVRTVDGGAIVGMEIGAKGEVANSAGQDFRINYRNASNVVTSAFSVGITGSGDASIIGGDTGKVFVLKTVGSTLNNIAMVNDALGFYGATPTGKPTVVGDRQGNPGVTALLGSLAATGLITNSTTDSGNISVPGTITGSNLSGTNTGDQTTITGNAGTATKLQTPRAINGIGFDGSADINISTGSSSTGLDALTLTNTSTAAAVTKYTRLKIQGHDTANNPKDVGGLRFTPQVGDPDWINSVGRLDVRRGDAIVPGLVLFGNLSPEGVVAAPVGALFTRQDGTPGATLYVKESGSGNTGWRAV